MNENLTKSLNELTATVKDMEMVNKLQAVEIFCTTVCATISDSAVYAYIRDEIAPAVGIDEKATKDIARSVKTHRQAEAKEKVKAEKDKEKAEAKAEKDKEKAKAKAEADAIKRETATKAKNANIEIVQTLQNDAPIYFDNIKLIWMWDDVDKIYKKIDEYDVLCKVRELTGEPVYEPKDVSEVITLTKQTGRARGIEPPDANVIVFKGGAIDITTGEIFTPDPSKHYTTFIPHKMGESEDTPTIDKLFDDWVGESAITLFETLAYCMLDAYPIHNIQAFIGSGSNGKGLFIKMIDIFIGKSNTVATSLELVAKSRFETAKLYHHKVAIMTETDGHTLTHTAMLKALSAGDPVPGEFKGITGFTFENTAKIIMTTNTLSKTTDRTDGFYRRWVITTFGNTFPPGIPVLEKIPEVEYENLLLKCVRVLRELLKRGRFTLQGTIEEQRAMYELKSDPMTAFISEKCNEKDGAIVPMWYLSDLYQAFAKKNGYAEMSKVDFKTALKLCGYILSIKYYSKEEGSAYKQAGIEKGTDWLSVENLGLKRLVAL